MVALKGITMKKVFFGTSAAGCLFGTLYYFFPSIVEMGIRSQINVDEGSMLYPNWIKFPIAINNQFRFFEVENPEQALRGAKIKLRERGPYCFKQYRRKKILWYSEDKKRVKYYEYKTYVEDYVTQGCERKWDEPFTILNAPVVALGVTIGDLVMDNIPLPSVISPVIFSTFNTFLASHGQNLFMKRSARELLMGYKINILETIASLVKPLEALGIKGLLPEEGPKDNVFGLLYGRNNTPEGPYEMWTGVGESSRNFSQFISWKDRRNLKWWSGEECNRIIGGDGTAFPPYVKKTDRLWLYNADVCRSVPLDFVNESEFKGIPVLRYGFAKEFFTSTYDMPENECFCNHKVRRYRCKQNGVFDLGACQAGAPILLTKPHFLDSNPDLTKFIDGLSPDPNIHQGFIEVEPISGAGINAVGKLQFAFRVERIPFLRGFDSIQNATIPLAWITESGSLTDELAAQVKNQLLLPVKASSLGIGGITGATLFTALMLGLMLILRKKKPQVEPAKDQKVIESNDLNNNAMSQDNKKEPYTNDAQPNGLVPISSDSHSMYPAPYNEERLLQQLMLNRWDGVLLNPGQLGLALVPPQGLNSMNDSMRMIFVPLTPDMISALQQQASQRERIHSLLEHNSSLSEDMLPSVDNPTMIMDRPRSAEETRRLAQKPLLEPQRSLENRYFSDNYSLLEEIRQVRPERRMNTK